MHPPGVGSLLKQLAEGGLTNVRVIRHDAVEVVAAMIPHDIARRRPRLLSRPVAQEAPSQAAAPDRARSCTHWRCASSRSGYLHVATDWEEYAQEILAVLAAEPLLANTAPDFAPRPEHRPLTKFETRGLKLGHGVRDLFFRRKARQ